MSEREQYGTLADELEEHAKALDDRNEQLGEQIADVHDEWERKRADGAVPGATPDWDDPEDDPEEDDDDEDDDDDDEDEDD